MYTMNERIWVYTYDFGLLEAVFKGKCSSSTCHIQYPKGTEVLMETINIHNTEALAKDYATAINYKRGWLKREFQNNPSKEYKEQQKSSIESFPEMWI